MFIVLQRRKKMTKTGCKIPFNMAKNLRLRNDDKLKLAVLEKDDSEEKDNRSGDLLLLTQTEVPSVNSVTFSASGRILSLLILFIVPFLCLC